MARTIAAMLLAGAASACDRPADAPEQAQRISLEAARRMPAEPLPSPTTDGARWTVGANGQAIDFGAAGQAPWLTLACDVRQAPATLTIVRHVRARPGLKALFPVIGNGTISRFPVDAVLHDGEWRWEGKLPAADPLLDVFTGPRDLTATLPGGGMLEIEGSRIPGEFVNWCRAGGRVQRAVAEEEQQPPAPAEQ